jgi:hypothetical protein
VPLPELRSPLARAVVPVLAGIGVLAVLGLLTWLTALYIARGGADTTERLAPTTFDLGSVERRAATIAEEGPIVLPGLNTTTGGRTIVVNHTGEDPTRGWQVYWAYPADRDPSCLVEQVRGTTSFTDCDGRTIDVSELAPPEGVFPVVENRSKLIIDLRGAVTGEGILGGILLTGADRPGER